MHSVTVLWSAVAGGALAMAGGHAALWLMDPRARANLAFGIVALAVAGIAITELGMMQAASAADYARWVRWFHLPNAVAVIGLVAVVHLQFRSGRVWLAGSVVALRALILVLNFILEPNVTWSEISSLRTIAFLGEPVSVIGAAVVRQPIQWLATLSSMLFIVYVADALATAWRKGEREARRKSMVICGGILLYITLAIVESQLVVWNVIQMPIVVSPPFVVLLAAITYELSRATAASLRMEREAARLREELAHGARVKTVGQLSGALAHELKQPLTSILADAQTAQMMLGSGKLDLPELQAIVADIVAADKKADAIIERARSLMKSSASELEPVSLESVVMDVLALVQVDAVQHGITLEHSLPPALPQVRADRVQLSQVLLNLVRNAMDAVSAERPSERKVRIEARAAGNARVEVAVIDSGTGIADELLPRLFDAFVTTKAAGLGIGLALCRAIVQAHGGELVAQNNPGRGATLRFTLATA